MAKTPPISVRLDPDVLEAIQAQAKAEDRSVSYMIARICVGWVAQLRTRSDDEGDGRKRHKPQQ